ncbi:MAG: DUF6498-containing protein [Microbacteriaceae bacterium]
MIARIIQFALYLIFPLLGIFVWGWDWRSVILLYWLENITIGLITVFSMLRTEKLGNPYTPNVGAGMMPQRTFTFTLNGQAVPPSGQAQGSTGGTTANRAVMTGFFFVHYGLFTFVHGVFVFLLIFGVFNLFNFNTFMNPGIFSPTPSLGLGLAGLDLVSILITWGVASIIQVILSVLQPRASLAPLSSLMFSPYKRIFVLHFTVIIGIVLIQLFGWPAWAAVLLVVFHALSDLGGLFKKSDASEQENILAN